MEEESMSYAGFARPDLCSIRAADEQDELAEAGPQRVQRRPLPTG